jgi:hypothetical protein
MKTVGVKTLIEQRRDRRSGGQHCAGRGRDLEVFVIRRAASMAHASRLGVLVVFTSDNGPWLP